LSVSLSMRNTALLDRTVIIKVTGRREGGIGGGMNQRGEEPEREGLMDLL